jgi:hypothetical protein
MGHDMNPGFIPRQELAVLPDPIAFVDGHCFPLQFFKCMQMQRGFIAAPVP